MNFLKFQQEFIAKNEKIDKLQENISLKSSNYENFSNIGGQDDFNLANYKNDNQDNINNDTYNQSNYYDSQNNLNNDVYSQVCYNDSQNNINNNIFKQANSYDYEQNLNNFDFDTENYKKSDINSTNDSESTSNMACDLSSLLEFYSNLSEEELNSELYKQFSKNKQNGMQNSDLDALIEVALPYLEEQQRQSILNLVEELKNANT